MRKLIMGTMCLVWAAGGSLLAQDGKDAKELEKIRTLRASLLVKLPVMNDVFDNEHNGINAAANALLKKYQDASAALTKQIDVEEAKGEARDKVSVEALRAKLVRFQTMWSDRASKASPVWSKSFNELNATRINLNQVVTDQTNIDQYWLRADCDRALFVAILTELNKRVDDVKDQGTALIAEWLKKTEDDARVLQD